AAPGDVRLAGAIHRHPDRGSRRPVPALARPRAGRGVWRIASQACVL
ncbi:MAG: Threonyl-tRNA synthetase, partial [uncultured Microvirga sp.]